MHSQRGLDLDRRGDDHDQQCREAPFAPFGYRLQQLFGVYQYLPRWVDKADNPILGYVKRVAY